MKVIKLIKSLTSISLVLALFSLHVETGAVAWSSAYAEEPADVTTEGNNNPNSEPTVQADVIQEDTAVLDYRSSEQEMGKMSTAQIMTALALIVGPSMIKMCSNQPSALIFGAGGAIMLVMEIMNYSSYKKASTSSQEMYAELDPETTDAQVEAFTKAAEQERTASAALKKKASAIGTFATMSTVAAVIAAVELVLKAIPQINRDDTCSGASTGYNANPNANGMYANAQLWLPPVMNESFTGYMTRMNEMDSYYFSNAVQSPTSAESFVMAEKIEKEFLPTQQTNQMLSTFYTITKSIGELVLSSASAKESEKMGGGILSIVGIGSAALGVILAMKVATWEPVAKVFSTPYASSGARIAIFGIFAGMAFAAKGEVNKAADRLEENAKVYDNLRDQLIRAISGMSRFAGMGGAQQAVRNRIAGYQNIRDEAMNPPNGGICLVGPPGERTVDEQCVCAKNNSCATAGFSSVGFDNQGLPGFLNESVDGLAGGANALFAGNLSGANSAFGSVGQNAAKLRGLKDKMKIKGNGILKDKKIGHSVDDFEKEFEKMFKKEGPRLLASLPSNQRNLLTGLSSGSTGTGISAEELSKKGTKEVLASVQAAVGGGAPNKGSPLDGFKFDFGQEEAKEGIAGQEVAAFDNSGLGDFVTNESDISDRPNENIFKIITVRYFKSAYPRFFEDQSTK